MSTPIVKLSPRSIKDVTTVCSEDISASYLGPKLVEVAAPSAAVSTGCMVVCIASGKGGTGKSVVSTNLAVSLAKHGLKTLLFDADMGLANAHLLLGVTPEHDISDVLDGSMSLDDVLIECASGVNLVCGASGHSEFCELADSEMRHLSAGLGGLEKRHNVMIVDLSAGISPQVVRFMGAAHDTIVVTTTDVTAMLDAYATIKVLEETFGRVSAKIIVNRAKERDDAIAAFDKIREVAAKRLQNTDLSFFGWLPDKWYVRDSVLKRIPLVECHSRSLIAASLRAMADKLAAAQEDWNLMAQTGENAGNTASFAWKLGQLVYN